MPSAINSTGCRGAIFSARQRPHGRPAADRGGAYAYLLGFLCHFALDAACHGYIENKIAVSHVTHTEIESEFDRFLLERQGIEPLSARLSGTFALRRRTPP